MDFVVFLCLYGRNRSRMASYVYNSHGGESVAYGLKHPSLLERLSSARSAYPDMSVVVFVDTVEKSLFWDVCDKLGWSLDDDRFYYLHLADHYLYGDEGFEENMTDLLRARSFLPKKGSL